MFQDAAVVGFVGRDDVVGAEFFLGVEAGDFAHFAAAVGAGENFDGIGGGGFDVAGFDEIAVDAVLDDFGDAADVCGDDRDFTGHGSRAARPKDSSCDGIRKRSATESFS